MDLRASRRQLRALWLNVRLRIMRWPMMLACGAIAGFLLVLFLVMPSQDSPKRTLGVNHHNGDIEALLAWLAANGAELHPCVSVSMCGSGGGRCVMASCDIRKADKMLSVPRSVQLHPSRSQGSPLCPQLGEWLEQPVSEGGGAGYHLDIHAIRLALRLLEERALGERSSWVQYLPTVPPSFASVLWDESEQQRCLAETSGAPKISRRFARYAAERELIRRCLVANGARRADDELLRWAMHAVGSRSYELWEAGPDSDGKRPVAVMVPLADMFNDDPENNAQWGWNEASLAFEITALSEIREGAEILVSYGRKTNEQLLTHYGFVHSCNTQDMVSVDLLDPTKAAMAMRRVNILLSFDGHLSASRLPASLGDLRNYLTYEAEERSSAQGYDLETMSLTDVRQYCKNAAIRWRRAISGGADTMCASYRESLAALAQACADFAVFAVQETATLAAGGKPATSDPVLSASTGVGRKAAELTLHLLQAWRADVGKRLSETGGARQHAE